MRIGKTIVVCERCGATADLEEADAAGWFVSRPSHERCAGCWDRDRRAASELRRARAIKARAVRDGDPSRVAEADVLLRLARARLGIRDLVADLDGLPLTAEVVADLHDLASRYLRSGGVL